MPKVYHLTSESVTEGHPTRSATDLRRGAGLHHGHDPGRRNAGRRGDPGHHRHLHRRRGSDHGLLCAVDEVARQTVEGIGYTRAKFGFDYETIGC